MSHMRKVLVILTVAFFTLFFISCTATSPTNSKGSSTTRLASSTAMSQTVSTQNPYKDELCAVNENVMFSFKVKNSNKIVSICVAKDQSYIVYRYGTKDTIELEYPKDRTNSWSDFTFRHFIPESGPDTNELSFLNNGIGYDIYEVNKQNGITLEVDVYDSNSTKQISNITGDSNTMVGSLSSFRSNGKIRIDQTVDMLTPVDRIYRENGGTSYVLSIAHDADYTYTIRLLDSKSNELQSLKLGSCPEGVTFEDVNFDGHTDIVANTGGTENEAHDLYVWDITSKKYVKVIYKGFEVLSFFELHDGTIRNFIRGTTPNDSVLQTLLWDGNTLVLDSSSK